MFELTPAAAQQIQTSAQASGATDLCLRVAARRDGGEMQYGMGFDEAQDDDVRLDLHGVAVVIGADVHELLEGTVLDFVELNPGEFNFVFIPPGHPSCGTPSVTSGGCGSGGCAGCSGHGGAH
ncbi:MAG: hypothetical protein Fur007_08250 [Rhodoferax sp.]